ncbi:MAG TPA: ABC transporter permease [Daejeonella sp.]|uniref:ABC transporter permease n=1 Tax=Daejeonella sp. TaxID=2805397 RepID=UPI002ED87573
MLKNYFKTAWRNMLNSKGYSSLNILGLSSGMAVALIIGLWVFNEFSYDRFLPDADRLYQVRRNYNSNGDTLNFTSTSLKLADALRNQIPEIEYVAESDHMGSHGLMVGEKKLYVNGAQINGDFLKMFQYPLIQGNANSVLKDPYSIVLTETTAKSLFGNEDPINKTVRFENKHDLKVTGILKDIPANSSLKFNFLIPFSFFEQTNQWVKEQRNGSFGGNSFGIYVKLKPGIRYEQVVPKIRHITKTESTSENAMNSEVIFQPLLRWHLYSKYINGKDVEGFIDYVRMFSIIGFLVLLIACINFINLTTARSEKRAREVGVRKAIGSDKSSLIFQFLIESLLYTAIAFLFSVLLVQLALPSFNTLTGNQLAIPYLNGGFWIISLICVLLTALLAGSRPAFYLSSFNTVKVLKGGTSVGKSASLPRKILVVAQFSCSIALVISTVVIYQQIQHAKERPTGYNLNRLVSTDMNADLENNFIAIKNELLQKRIVSSVTAASSPATNIWWHTGLDQWPGKNPGETIEMGTIVISDDYFKTLGMEMSSGRVYNSAADTTNIIFNEAAIAQMRIKEPLGKIISWNETPFRIIGIVKNALMISPFVNAEPTMFVYGKPAGNLMYQLAPGIKTEDAISQLTSTFNKYNPSIPYQYTFADDSYAAKFRQELLIGKLSGIFSGLAIFISCLGLFGLAAYIAEQRTREIGIRKVLGASISQVWLMLSKDFILLVLISCVIASPLAYYFLQDWLQKYAYRINIGMGVFLVAAVMALFVTLITVSFQAIKAAMMNPVKSLRSE